jgi:hypothetical protein
MKTFALVLALALQTQPQTTAPPAAVRATLREARDQYAANRATLGVTPAFVAAKHQLRDWVESQLPAAPDIDTRAVAQSLHTALREAGLICNDCDENALGFVDPVRVTRQGEFLIVITSMGIACSYDDSAYVYVPHGAEWRRIWEYERNPGAQAYLPQAIHDVEMSAPDANGRRTLMVLGSQPPCRGSFLNVYARAWQVASDYRSELVLDRRELGYDAYPPILGRVRPGDVMFQYTADGFLSGDVHVAVRHYAVGDGTPRQLEPIAGLPRDFVLEWLDAPWEQSRARSESSSLQFLHDKLRRDDSVGDTA